MAGTVHNGGVFGPFWVGQEGDIYRNAVILEGSTFANGTIFEDVVFAGIDISPILTGEGNIIHAGSMSNVILGFNNVVSKETQVTGPVVVGPNTVYRTEDVLTFTSGLIKTNIPCQHTKEGDADVPVEKQCPTEHKEVGNEVQEKSRA